MAKSYKNVSEMLKTHGDASDCKKFNELISSTRISKTLFALRCKAGLTQEELADKLKLSQSKISKIESSVDYDLNIKDIVLYCNALNVQLNIGFSDIGMNLVDMVKYHWFKLKNYLDDIISISKGDRKMELGAREFTNEAACNVAQGLLQCLEKTHSKKIVEEALHVSKPIRKNELEENIGQEQKATT